MRRDNALWAMLDGRAPLPAAARTLGWRLDAHNETDRSVSVSFVVGAEPVDPLGCIRPGTLAAMLDDCMRPAIGAELPPGHEAVRLESDNAFLLPARPGRWFGYGRIEHWRGALCVVRARLSDEAGRVVATAIATYRIDGPR